MPQLKVFGSTCWLMSAWVLCYFEEKTYTEAARVLGLAAGTVSSRLARARDILRKRLARRGLTLSAGLLATVLSQNALSASLPAALLAGTTKAAQLFAIPKETPEDMRLGMRQDLALPILESSSTGSWSNSAQTSEDSYAV